MGYALARAAAAAGWSTELISGPVNLPEPAGISVIRVETGQQLFEQVSRRFPECDILIMTAAIMDYRPREVADHKIKKHELRMVIEMEPVVDVLATVARNKSHQLIVGFAAETNDLIENARKKLQAKNADYIIANKIGGQDGAFGKDENEVIIISADEDPVRLGPLSKDALAKDLVERFKSRLDDAGV